MNMTYPPKRLLAGEDEMKPSSSLTGSLFQLTRKLTNKIQVEHFDSEDRITA